MIKCTLCFFIFSISFGYCFSQGHQKGLPGNTIVEYIQDKTATQFFRDPINDTINYRYVKDKIYKDKFGKVYILTECYNEKSDDTLVYTEYFKDESDFLDLKAYRGIKDDYFVNKGKVYLWFGNSDGAYPCEIVGADPKTFKPFKDVAGGKDKLHVFYGGPPDDLEIIKDANPKTIRILNPKRGCWNCNNCYFVDDKRVFFGADFIPGADPHTFKLLNEVSTDAMDKNGKYFDGKLIH